MVATNGHNSLILSVDQISFNEKQKFLTIVKDGANRSDVYRLVNNIPGIVGSKNKDLRYQACNKGFLNAAGVNHIEDIIGKEDSQLYWDNFSRMSPFSARRPINYVRK